MSLFRRNKNNNKPIIRQIIDLIPNHISSKSINRFKNDKYCHKYKTYNQLVALLFGQLCKSSTMEDISVGIWGSETFISDLGLEQIIFPKGTLIIEDKGYWDFKVIKYRIQCFCYPYKRQYRL